MQIHNLVQGSPEWQKFRLDHDGASEAAAMLGISPKVKRNELLHMKHTGTPKEFSDWVQENILDYGHEVEALARPIIEEHIGEDLYPVTCSDGKLSASCDGLTMGEDIAFEHKQYNAKLYESVAADVLPDEYMPQCQQIMMITGAQKVIFTVSDGTPEKMVHMEVFPDPEWFERIRAGWEQFSKDLAEYKPREIAEKPQAEAILHLPALAVQIRGEVVTSNLPAFKVAAEQFIANIKTDLQTDQDFSDAEATVKFCEESEKKLELAKESALSQTASIDELLRTVDYIKEQLRDKRLMLDKLVTNKKKEIKERILVDARDTYLAHVVSLEAEIKPIRLVYQPTPDFITAAKNKRTLASLHDAVDTELARAKIVVNEYAKDARAKLAWCKTNADGYGFLFSDLQQIVQKPMDDFQMVINSRVTAHKDAEEAKLKAERDRIAEEERVKAEAKVKADQEAAQVQRVEAPAPSVEAIATSPVVGNIRYASSMPLSVKRPVVDNRPPITTGALCALAGDGLSITAVFIQSKLHVSPAERPKEAKSGTYWAAADVPVIFMALARHFEELATTESALAA